MADNETSRDKKEAFRRLATKRVRKAIKDIQLIGNLANKANYDYDDEQVRKIMRALSTEMKTLKAKFEAGGDLPEDQFEL